MLTLGIRINSTTNIFLTEKQLPSSKPCMISMLTCVSHTWRSTHWWSHQAMSTSWTWQPSLMQQLNLCARPSGVTWTILLPSVGMRCPRRHSLQIWMPRVDHLLRCGGFVMQWSFIFFLCKGVCYDAYLILLEFCTIFSYWTFILNPGQNSVFQIFPNGRYEYLGSYNVLVLVAWNCSKFFLICLKNNIHLA